ncbi:hypothetical protein DN069_16590 [Streptacidiphilus pinicola]|uniref:Tat pathway signal sequence domain protein n=1 Tax=Streptacidiphilus pinicola TaxID=2219663 RepID=A0A2X0JAC7_9ACTN|nr:hypothetical protein [Streptacidiphilus pinicola]RAG84468.1 hypothetical protein DN069_16590 [Streptacidiphilus pinicola]
MAGRRRGFGADDDARPSAISETELIVSQDASPARVEVLESRSTTIRHKRVYAAGTFTLLLVAALVLYLTRPQPQPPVPTAWPAENASVGYGGTLPVHDDPTGRTADFVVSVRNQDRVSMTVIQITFAYRGLTLRTEPRLPLPVQPGQTVRIQLIVTAADCSGIPENDALPFVDITFRNIRAIGQESEILGDRYTLDLHRAMTAACRRG